MASSDSHSPVSSPVPSDSGGATSPEAPPAWFEGHARAVQARLDSIEEGYNSRLEKFRAKYLETSRAKDAEPKTVSQDDLKAAVSFGQALAGLDDAQRESIQAMADSHGFAVAAQAASLISRQSAQPPATQVAPPRGVGASPAPSQPSITTLSEYRALKKAAPERARALLEGGLEISKLPR